MSVILRHEVVSGSATRWRSVPTGGITSGWVTTYRPRLDPNRHYLSGTPEGDVPAEWVEVNIESPPLGERERLLLEVVDPLIHQTLADRIDAWHYFWEPALRLPAAT